MKPLCPRCLNEMSKTTQSRNMFNCQPCREFIQFFGARVNVASKRSVQPSWLETRRPVRTARAA